MQFLVILTNSNPWLSNSEDLADRGREAVLVRVSDMIYFSLEPRCQQEDVNTDFIINIMLHHTRDRREDKEVLPVPH